MLKVSYRNPMSELYAAAYAVCLLAESRFAGIRFASPIQEGRLRLYYMDLTRVTPSGNISYEAQDRLDKALGKMLDPVFSHLSFNPSEVDVTVHFRSGKDSFEILFDGGSPDRSLALVFRIQGRKFILTSR